MRILILISFLFFGSVKAAPLKSPMKKSVKIGSAKKELKKVVYAENQVLDFEGLSLEGELKAPGEFYFQNRNQERFDSLTKRRLNFRREMMRDCVQSN
jgi:hypothetical protein